MTEAAQEEPVDETAHRDEVAIRYIDLANEKAELEAKLASVKKKLEDAEQEVLTFFEETGMERISAGGRTIYIRRELNAAKADDSVTPEQIGEALAAAGLDIYYPHRVNWQSLSAFLREREKEGQGIPAELASVVRLSERFKIGSRTS